MPPKAKLTKQDIQASATELVRERGIAGLTAKALAAKLKCSTQPIFWAYENMEEVRRSVRDEALQRFGEYLREPQEGASAYLSVGLNYIRFAEEEKELFKLLFMSEDGEDILTAHKEMPYVLSVIEQTENISGKEAQNVYEEMWMLSHGIATMIATGTARFTKERIRGILHDVYYGILQNVRKGK
ncbi:MAG: TetR/AcrR family transcriptional regulator [Bacillota bacterium]|nr:MAG: TetR/AcrR family transcriptional regulator [Bacillota bacterium]